MPPRLINNNFTDFGLTIRRSQIHRLGLFAEEPIPARYVVIEYAGKRLTWQQVLECEKKRTRRGVRTATYLFKVNRLTFVDGSRGGSGAELANHSCDPNLAAVVLKRRLFYFSRRPIKAGEELTLDYRFSPQAEIIPCQCGSPKCRGTINEKSARKRQSA